MSDTQLVGGGIGNDAPSRWKLTEPAVRRLMRVLGVTEVEELARRLGFSRQTFWRLRTGEYDIRLSEANRLRDVARWPLGRMFTAVRHEDREGDRG